MNSNDDQFYDNRLAEMKTAVDAGDLDRGVELLDHALAESTSETAGIEGLFHAGTRGRRRS